MLQIKNGILFIGLAIFRRSVNKRTPLHTGTRRAEQHLLNIAVRHILKGIELFVMSGNLDTALPSARTVIIERSRIIERTAVDYHVVIVETLVHWTLGSSHPRAVGLLFEFRASSPSKTERHSYRLGFGRLHTEAGITLRVYHRILLSGLVFS